MLTEEQKSRLLELEKAELIELDEEIDRLERQTAPLLEQLDRLRESRKLALRKQELRNGTAAKIVRIGRAVRRRRNGDPIWSVIAAEHSIEVGAASAHLVVAKVDPALHASIEHQNCAVDNRSYP